MKKYILAALAASLARSSFAVVKIVTTTPDLAAIASAVGGSNVTVSSLVSGARDPHRIEAKPSFMSRVSSADLFLAIGLELEIGYEQPILEGSRNSRVQVGQPGHVYAASWVPVIDKPTGPISRAQGDIHPYGNPHIWLDPYNGRIIAARLAEKLGALDPTHEAAFRANAAQFNKRIDDAMFGNRAMEKYGSEKLWDWQKSGNLRAKVGDDLGGWSAKMAPLYGKPIVTYHKSFNYFANRFGIKVVDELEPK